MSNINSSQGPSTGNRGSIDHVEETVEKVTQPQNQSKEGPSQERTDFDMK